MILEYHRPTNLEDALFLLSRPTPMTIPLAGGTFVNRAAAQDYAVVDLQSLELDGVQKRGNLLELGAMVRLQRLLDDPSLDLPAGLNKALEQEATINLRQAATLAGSLITAGGRSSLAAAFLALDASLTLLPGDDQISLGDFLPLRAERLQGRLITRVNIPTHVRIAYEAVARTPADLPIVGAAVAVWPSGRTRLALCGFGKAPLLAFDGAESQGAEIAARSAYSQAGDEWATSAYRQEMAGVLVERALQSL